MQSYEFMNATPKLFLIVNTAKFQIAVFIAALLSETKCT